MELQDLLAPVAGVFDLDDALESWHWVVPGQCQLLAVSAFGDLFLINSIGAILFLDTFAGTCTAVAESVSQWEKKILAPEVREHWFMPALVNELRENGRRLSEGECYHATHPIILGGKFEAANFQPTPWRVHFHGLGQIHEQVKDLPSGTKITKIHYTEI